MKTKISLSIVGVFNILMSLFMAFAIKSIAPTMLNSDSQENNKNGRSDAAMDYFQLF